MVKNEQNRRKRRNSEMLYVQQKSWVSKDFQWLQQSPRNTRRCSKSAPFVLMDEQSHWYHLNKQKCKTNDTPAGRRLFPQAIAIQLTDRNLSAWSLPSIWPVIRRLAWEMIDHFTGKYHSCERVSYKLGWAGKTHNPHISPPSPDRSSPWQPKQKCFADILHVEGWQS